MRLRRTPRAKRVLSLAAIAALLFSFIPALVARADIAPPQQAPGSNIEPGIQTKVQMAAERVVIELLRVKGKGKDGLPLANVTAAFQMRNPGEADESMPVRFPLTDPSGFGDGFGGHPEIENFVVKVDGKTVPFRIVTTPNPQGADQKPIKWAEFDVTFPKGKDTNVEVSYVLQSTGFMPYGTFKYILETGAGWDGPIGKAEFVLKLPYAASEENIVTGQSTTGATFENGEARWTLENLEPTRADNFIVTVLAPVVWDRIQAARQATQDNPNSAQAWRDLAQAYLSAIYVRYGPQIGQSYVPLVEEAYKKAQSLDDTSAQLRAELAQVLVDLAEPIAVTLLEPGTAEKIFAELKAALERDARNALARSVASNLRAVLTQMAQGAGDEAKRAAELLAELNTIAPPTAAEAEATATATPTEAAETATPTVEATPAPVTTSEPVTETNTVTEVRESSAVITTTITSTETQAITGTATSRPVVIVIARETSVVTETADVTGTVPATVTEVSETTITTTTVPSEEQPAAGTTVTATVVTTDTATADETGTVVRDGIPDVAETTVTTTTTEASPLDATRIATVTQVIVGNVISRTQAREDAPAAGTVVTATTTTTQTMPMDETGGTDVDAASTVTATTTTTATTEASAIDATQPATVTVISVGDVISRTRPDAATPGASTAVTATTVTTQTTPVDEATGTTDLDAEATSTVTATTTTTATTEADPIDANKPATTTVIVNAVVISPTVLNPEAPAASTVVTATTVTTATTPMAQEGATAPPVTSVVTATNVTTVTTEADPLDTSQPATVTVVGATTVNSTTVDTTGVEASAVPTRTDISETTVTTSTTPMAEPGATAPPPTIVVTDSRTITVTIPMAMPGATPGASTVITATRLQTATIDPSGIITPSVPIIAIVTGTLPSAAAPTGTAPAGETATPEATAVAAAEATDTSAEPTVARAGDATPATGAAEATPATDAGASAPAASTSPLANPVNVLMLLAAYGIGGGVVYGIHRSTFRRDDERMNAGK